MTLICVLGMSLLVASQHFFTQRLVSLHEQRDLLLRLGQDLLQMRRHEKDFLLRHQIDYFNRFNERADIFNNHLKALVPLFKEFSLPDKRAGELAQGVHDYQKLFQKVVHLQLQIGLNTAHGLQGELASVEAMLSRESAFAYGTQLYQQFVIAQLSIRNFLLTKDAYYQQQFDDAVNQAKMPLSDTSSSAAKALENYRQTFAKLADATTAMGITHQQGLTGDFRRQAHLVEAQLNQLDQDLQPMIELQENQVRTYSISIAGLTSVTLILLLIKSFATFHRAFANFVMFFYRCKRQYQKIDPRQLGFAEFKSLAELANDMVESRRDIERKLATAEARLEESTHVNPTQ